MSQHSYNRMRELQAIDALDDMYPLAPEEVAEKVYLELMFKITGQVYDWTY